MCSETYVLSTDVDTHPDYKAVCGCVRPPGLHPGRLPIAVLRVITLQVIPKDCERLSQQGTRLPAAGRLQYYIGGQEEGHISSQGR